MPKVPIIQEFAKTPANDFYVFQWRWEDQTNLTIHTTGVWNPIGARLPGHRYQAWPSFNGDGIPADQLANSIKSSDIKLDNIELILKYGGQNTLAGQSYAGQLAEALGDSYGVISYSSTSAHPMDKIQEALKELPDAITGDATALNKIAELPGLAVPSVSRCGRVSISRFKGAKRLHEAETRSMQPYHVRAGKRPNRPADVAGSMPRAAGSAAGGRIGGSPARGAAPDAEEMAEMLGA